MSKDYPNTNTTDIETSDDVSIFVDSITSTVIPDLTLLPSSSTVNDVIESDDDDLSKDKEREAKRLAFAECVEDNLIEDYEKSRETLHSVLKSTANVFVTASQEALVSGDPKTVSALASLTNAINATTKSLIDLSEKVSVGVSVAALGGSSGGGTDLSKGVVGKRDERVVGGGSVTNNIQNNVTVNHNGNTSSSNNNDLSTVITTEELLASLYKNKESIDSKGE